MSDIRIALTLFNIVHAEGIKYSLVYLNPILNRSLRIVFLNILNENLTDSWYRSKVLLEKQVIWNNTNMRRNKDTWMPDGKILILRLMERYTILNFPSMIEMANGTSWKNVLTKKQTV